MSIKKTEVPPQLKHIFIRTKWQSKENKKAIEKGEKIEPDGVKWHQCAIHFPQGFFAYELIKQEFIRLQVVHGTRGMKRETNNRFIKESRPEKPVFAYGYPVSGTNKLDIFQQLATIGMDLIDAAKGEEKDRLIKMVTLQEPLERERPESIERRKDDKSIKPIYITQIQFLVTEDLFERICSFQNEHKIKNRANIFYFLCLVALDSFEKQ